MWDSDNLSQTASSLTVINSSKIVEFIYYKFKGKDKFNQNKGTCYQISKIKVKLL